VTRAVRTIRIDAPDSLLAHPPDVAWIHDALAMVGWGEAARIDAGIGDGRFARAAEAWRRMVEDTELDDEVNRPGSGLVGFGSFTFDGRSPGSAIIVPQVLIGRSGGGWWLTTVDGADPSPYLRPADDEPGAGDRPRYAGASIPDVMWIEAVAEAIRRIEAGEIEKVVLARDVAVWSKAPFDRRVVLQRLHDRFPECFTFLVDGLVGASPELLVRLRDRTVESLALAGSARRDPDPEEDWLVGKALLSSDKDRREHEAAAASVGAALGEVCRTLERDAEPWLLRLANVQHLATRFMGELGERRPVLDLVDRLHPTAAVGGTPTAPAVEVIRRLEGMDRGRYAGPVGWLDHHGDGDWAIALRCAELSGARARLFAGAGIVAGSLPENELEETRLKLRAMMGVLEG
jgi:menaquinone-specific isochorismate synthase